LLIGQCSRADVTRTSSPFKRRPVWCSVAELQEVIEQFLQAWNEAPRPFVWTATVKTIMAKVERARQKLEVIKLGWSKRKKRKNQE
jgi:hypothetical protein